MRTNLNRVQLLTVTLICSFLFCSVSAADGYKEKEHEKDSFPPVTNNTYKEECGTCHFSYQPGLLPSGSWTKILETLPSHFGEDISMDKGLKDEIEAYLRKNSAEYSASEEARELLHSLKGQTPLRITEIPYIQKEHHELGSTVLARDSIKSLSNCIACHKTAERGIYDDDNVQIPR